MTMRDYWQRSPHSRGSWIYSPTRAPSICSTLHSGRPSTTRTRHPTGSVLVERGFVEVRWICLALTGCRGAGPGARRPGPGRDECRGPDPDGLRRRCRGRDGATSSWSRRPRRGVGSACSPRPMAMAAYSGRLASRRGCACSTWTPCTRTLRAPRRRSRRCSIC